MAKIYYSKLTDLGMELVTTAISTAAKIGIDQFAVGDGGGAYYAPTGAEPALKREKYRGSVQRVSILGSRIIMDAVIPTTSTGYTVREIGIFTEAGQMVAIGNLPDIPKDAVTDGAIGELLITMELQVANADVFELVVDPNTLLVTKPQLDEAVDTAKAADIYIYKATLLLDGWVGDAAAGWVQTVAITSVDGGLAVTAGTQLLGPMILPTGVQVTDETLAEVLRIVNDGTATTGDGTVTCKAWEKPEADAAIYWPGKVGAE